MYASPPTHYSLARKKMKLLPVLECILFADSDDWGHASGRSYLQTRTRDGYN